MVSTRQMSTTLSNTGSTSPIGAGAISASNGNNNEAASSSAGGAAFNSDVSNANEDENLSMEIISAQQQQLISQPTSTIRFVNTRSTVLSTGSSSSSAVSVNFADSSIPQVFRCSTIRGPNMGGNNSSIIMMMFDENSRENYQYCQADQKIFLLDLPMEILGTIFSYVGYKKVGQLRVVSKQMNQVCSSVLNSTFSKLQTQMLNRFQNVKAKMPRRESARRNHPLACECDIIETCYMRLSLLQMTFGKHMERKHCCFFPGGILDEVYNVLHYIRTTPKLERPYRVTDELFDLSTMAMEYFKENIEPNLPEIGYFNKDFFDIPAKSKQTYKLKVTSEISDSCSSNLPSPPQSNMVLRKGIRKIKEGMKMYNNQLTFLRSELRNCKKKASEQGKQVAEQQKLLAEQQKQTLEYANRLDENDRKNEEMSRKFSTLLQELNKCKTELQYWRSKSPAVQICNSCGHKSTPVVPPEDFQALINQGIKPEDIIEDIDECIDVNSDNIFLEPDEQHLTLNINSTSSDKEDTEFICPDERTTAKLLAASSGKNLKRKIDDSHYNQLSVNPQVLNESDDTISGGSKDESSGFCAIESIGNSSKSTITTKYIPSITPSTFYPSSSSAFIETTEKAVAVQFLDGIKKRRMQKNGKRKINL